MRTDDKPPASMTSGISITSPIVERMAMIWNRSRLRVASRPATVMVSIRASQPPIHSAALGRDASFFMPRVWQSGLSAASLCG